MATGRRDQYPVMIDVPLRLHPSLPHCFDTLICASDLLLSSLLLCIHQDASLQLGLPCLAGPRTIHGSVIGGARLRGGCVLDVGPPNACVDQRQGIVSTVMGTPRLPQPRWPLSRV